MEIKEFTLNKDKNGRLVVSNFIIEKSSDDIDIDLSYIEKRIQEIEDNLAFLKRKKEYENFKENQKEIEKLKQSAKSLRDNIEKDIERERKEADGSRWK